MRPGTQVPYEELFEATPSGLVVIDGAGLVVLVNRRAEAMLGRGRGDLAGKPFGAAVAEHPGGADAALLAAGSDHPVELVLRRADGDEFTVEAITSRPAQVRAGLVVIALRDVTGRKRKEEALLARSRQQAAVAELGRRALTGIDLGQLMDEAVSVLVSDLGVEYANLLELLPDGRAVFRAGVGWRADLVGGTTLDLRAGTPAGQVILDQVPILIEDLRTDARFTSLSVAS